MNIDPREQAHAYDDWRVEDVPEPEMPEDRSEVRQVPEAVAAADVTKRKDTTVRPPRLTRSPMQLRRRRSSRSSRNTGRAVSSGCGPPI